MYKIDFEKPIHIHFIGIGGISMSGLAEILLEEGFTVTGSDSKESASSKNMVRTFSTVRRRRILSMVFSVLFTLLRSTRPTQN